jgi:hypothetical protein
MRSVRTRRLAFTAATAATALTVGLAAPVQASASTGIIDVQSVVLCIIGTVDQLLYGGPPPADYCAAVPGGV